MNDMMNVDIPTLKAAFKGAEQISVGDDFCIFEVRGTDSRPLETPPFRFDGMLLLWCMKGRLRVSVNLSDHEISDNMLFVCMPGNILKVEHAGVDGGERREDDDDDSHYVCMAMSRDFASSAKISFGGGLSKAISLLDDPRVMVTDEESNILREHLKLIGNVVNASLQYRKESAMAIWGSMLHVISGVLDRRECVQDDSETVGRNRQLMEQFLALVAEYHDRYRNVGFYADKLCLTPKYLSKLIKKVSGRSAPDWIDSFVILEAKNMLKYSDSTIKGIVYRLNFPNQSVFYKFFKARTGMTPSEYRKS